MQNEVTFDLHDPEGAVNFAHLSRIRRIYPVIKRALDLALCLPALLLLLPFLALIALAITFDSRGPVLFIQNRVRGRRISKGQNVTWQLEEFPCYKFRSMVTKADPALHQQYAQAFIRNDQVEMARLQGGEQETRKLVSDPRVTRVGGFLRRTSLDELPQLWNVLRGEMSLVGPRPPIAYEVEIYKPWHYWRFEATPGITGLWQVSARSTADFDEMVRLDLKYIEKQSLWLDLSLIMRTMGVVLGRRGGF